MWQGLNNLQSECYRFTSITQWMSKLGR